MPELYIPLLHPKIVHFPIAFFMGALGLEIVSRILRKEDLHKTAVILYVMAVLIAPLVVWSGLEEAGHLKIHHPVLAFHRKFALMTMWGALAMSPILWLVHKRFQAAFRNVFLIVLLVLAGLVTVTGHYGGRMVYEFGAGVAQ